jgi:acyl transferase domain-containing protein
MLTINKVKPNVGHSEGASGLTSIIKATLALEKGVIPPNTHFLNPNPKSKFNGHHSEMCSDKRISPV